MNDEYLTNNELDLTKEEYQPNFGRHLVRISKCSTAFSEDDNEGIKYEFKTATGQTISETYWLLEKSMFRLVTLAKACKLEDDKLRHFKPKMLINSFLEIETKRVPNESNGKSYLNVTDVFETNQKFEFYSAKADGFGDEMPKAYEPKPFPTQKSKDPFDDIPF